MKKYLGIMIAGVLLCGLAVSAMIAVPKPPAPATHIPIQITAIEDTNGVDTPWFELSISAGDTVAWKNVTNMTCHVVFPGKTLIGVNAIVLAPDQQSISYNASQADPCPQGWNSTKVCRQYHYLVICPPKGPIDPGGGVRP